MDSSNVTPGAVTDPSIAAMLARFNGSNQSLNDFFLCTMAIIVYFMQCGFALLEAGAVRSKNVTNILIKNILDSFIGGLSYYLVGYALAFGNPGNHFCGDKYWALSGLPATKYSHVLFNFMFAATAATIVSGSVAERCEFVGYLIYSALISGFMYPIITHWAWSPNGWLAQGASISFSDDSVTLLMKYHDFAGSGIVHLLGGTAALVAAIILRPRLGRFDPVTGMPREIRGHSVPLVSLGGFILFFGFLAFNGGSQGAIASGGDGQAVALSMVNTCLSGSSAAFVTMSLQKLRLKTWSLLSTINGGLAGMVAICAGCNAVQPWSALVIGLTAGLAYLTLSWLVLKLGCDDPLEAVGVHMGGGFVGVVSVAFFRVGDGIFINPSRQSGLTLLWQLVGAGAIVLWSAGLSIVIFGSLRLLQLFRVSEEFESKGLDIPKHGEPAYPLAAYGHGWEEKIPDLSLAGIEVFSRMHSSQKNNQTANGRKSDGTAIGHLLRDGQLPEVAAALDRADVHGLGRDNAAVDLGDL